MRKNNFVYGCAIKAKYNTFEIASGVISRRNRQSNVELYPYLCPHCLKYHITKKNNGVDVEKTKNLITPKLQEEIEAKKENQKREIGKFRQEINNLKQTIESKNRKIVSLSNRVNELSSESSLRNKEKFIEHQNVQIEELKEKIEVQKIVHNSQMEAFRYLKNWVKSNLPSEVYELISKNYPRGTSKKEAKEIIKVKE